MTRPRAAELLEKIARIIPGIPGYQDREKRRDADSNVRAKAAAEVAACRARISEGMDALSRSGGVRNLRLVGDLERLIARLERMEDELRFAPSGYAGWFDREGITLDDLERLYEYDLALLSAAGTLSDFVGEIRLVGTPDDWTPDLKDALRDLREAFGSRSRMLQNRED